MLGRVAETKKIKVLISAFGKFKRLLRRQSVCKVEVIRNIYD